MAEAITSSLSGSGANFDVEAPQTDVLGGSSWELMAGLNSLWQRAQRLLRRLVLCSLVGLSVCSTHDAPLCPRLLMGLPLSQVQPPSTSMPLTVFHNPSLLRIYRRERQGTRRVPTTSSLWLPSPWVGGKSQQRMAYMMMSLSCPHCVLVECHGGHCRTLLLPLS